MIGFRNGASNWGVALLLVALLASACEHEAQKHPGFFQQSLIDQHEAFRELSPEQQVDIYLDSLKRHPPDLGFAWDIAETYGERAVPAILARLSVEKSEFRQFSLIYVLERMAAPYGVTFDEETVAAVTDVVERMKYESFRTRAEKSLATIRSAVRRQGDVAPGLPSSAGATPGSQDPGDHEMR